jgi:ribosome-associated toxin RatA of RatAB toxin-antitoxin module
VETTISIDVEAPPSLVFALARDVERWPDLLPHYARVSDVERDPDGTVTASFTARRPILGLLGWGLPVIWRSRTWSEPGSRRLRFVHVAGATTGMDVTWRIEERGDGSHVAIDHVFRRRLPVPLLGAMLGDRLFPAFVDRFFTRPIAGRTLATFKAIAEAVHTSGSVPPTNEMT